MESILEQLGLGTLLESFTEERIDPQVVLSMSESCLIRLGLSTIGDRIRIKDLCKQYIESGSTLRPSSSLATSLTPSEQVREERRLLFQPYSQSRGGRGQNASVQGGVGRSGKRKRSCQRTWTGQFVCLADRQASRAPSAAEKQILQQAGLGLKKIQFYASDKEQDVLKKLTSDILDEDGVPAGFPQLKRCKGFEILQCSANSRNLVVVNTSWAVKDLKAIFTSQTKIYLRPIQQSLRTKGVDQTSEGCMLKDACRWCQQEFRVPLISFKRGKSLKDMLVRAKL